MAKVICKACQGYGYTLKIKTTTEELTVDTEKVKCESCDGRGYFELGKTPEPVTAGQRDDMGDKSTNKGWCD